jgi:hypothetical protein
MPYSSAKLLSMPLHHVVNIDKRNEYELWASCCWFTSQDLEGCVFVLLIHNRACMCTVIFYNSIFLKTKDSSIRTIDWPRKLGFSHCAFVKTRISAIHNTTYTKILLFTWSTVSGIYSSCSIKGWATLTPDRKNAKILGSILESSDTAVAWINYVKVDQTCCKYWTNISIIRWICTHRSSMCDAL